MINRIYSLLSSVGITQHQDKVLHFIVGFLITIIIAYLVSPGLGIFAGCSAAIGKELYDQYEKSDFNPLDMLATILGAVTAYSITFI